MSAPVETAGPPVEPVERRAPAEGVPVARVVKRRRGVPWVWVVPILAAVAAAALAYQAMAARGPRVVISFQNGDGIEPGDPVTYRDVRVGEVESVELSPDLRSVRVAARLRPEASGVAVEGSRFWIVRPEVSATRITGLETLLGPRYIRVEPGAGPARQEFVGLDQPPRQEQAAPPDGLVLVLEASRRGSLGVGAPVQFRGIKVGSVVDVGLSEDARFVLVTAVIEPRYATLVRTNTKFWNASGIGLDVGWLSGVTVRAGSVESVLAGGIGFATPDKAGAAVAPGTRFVLHPEPKDDWLEWRPLLLPPAEAP